MATVQLFAPPPPAPWDGESLSFMQVDLARSALIPEDMGAYPISSKKYEAPAYLIPYPGNENLWRVRIAREKDKYIAATNASPDIWIPPHLEFESMFDGDLWIVEGEKKAAAVAKWWQQTNVVGIGGCWNAVQLNKETGSYRLLERLQLLITPGRRVNLILDGDVIENKHVGQAALTLKSCIENLNGTMQLFRPPSEWKGVDDWIYQDKDASPGTLELVDYNKLAINRRLLYDQLGCSLNDKEGLILNELNGSKLLSYHFKALGIVRDKRLGFIDGTGTVVTNARLATIALHYLQGDIAPRYTAGAINGALAECVGNDNNQTDLVQDLIRNRLQWDGTPRLETWGSEQFETTFPKLADEWGRMLITGLVMRILEPGCKVDTVCILNGKQSIGKTTFFEDLGRIDGFDFYRSIADLPGTSGDDRTFKQTLVSAMLIDLGEGIIFESRKTSSDRLKQFITERYDEYRVAYAKANTITPRGYVFVGTTNRGDQLTDYTGSRRFLYLNVLKIKRLDYAFKLQLLAEVAARYAEIKASNWWDLRLTMDDMPAALREEHSHVTQVNELLNIEHYRADSLTELITQLIENDDISRQKSDNAQVVTCMFVAARTGSNNALSMANTVGRKFVELNSSPIYPYTFEKTRKRGAQLDFKQGHRELYTGHITNDQVMFTCFIIRKK